MEKLPPGKPGAQPIAGQFEGGILGWVLNLIGGKIGALIADLAQALLGGGNFADPNMNAIRDGQLDLNNNVELLSPLLDYGSGYMPNNKSGTGLVPYTEQIGPMQKCHLANGGIVFDDVGLWDIRAQVYRSTALANVRADWEIRVYRPDNTLFSVMQAGKQGDYSFSDTNITSVVVDAIGFYVQVHVTSMGGSAYLYGGASRNRLTVQHISRRTDIGDSGQG